MNPSAPLNIEGAVKELRRLQDKKKKGERLNDLEKDDFGYLEKYVESYQTAFSRLDYERFQEYEIWRDYLYDQRTANGTLLVDSVFAVLDRLIQGAKPDEYWRTVRRIRRIDAIMTALYEDEKGKSGDSGNANKGFDVGD